MTPEELKAAADKEAADAKALADAKVEFTEAQQTQIQKIMDTRFAKVNAKHAAEKNALQEQLEAAKAEAEGKGKRKEDEESPEKKQTRELIEKERKEAAKEKALREARDTAYTELETKHNGTLKQNAIREAAGNMFLDMEIIMAMVERKIEFDSESKKFVVKENGVVRENSSLEPMTLEEYFLEIGTKRPYLVNSKFKAGAGSSESNGNNPGMGKVTSKADLKTPAEKSKFIGSFGLKVWEALPLK
jgi:hypothetical protein